MWPPPGAENNSTLGPRLHLPVWGSGANLTAGWTHLEGVLAAERRPRHCCCCCRGLTWWPRAVAVGRGTGRTEAAVPTPPQGAWRPRVTCAFTEWAEGLEREASPLL